MWVKCKWSRFPKRSVLMLQAYLEENIILMNVAPENGKIKSVLVTWINRNVFRTVAYQGLIWIHTCLFLCLFAHPSASLRAFVKILTQPLVVKFSHHSNQTKSWRVIDYGAMSDARSI